MNLDDLQTWHYVLIGGGVALVLSFILYFLPTKKLKVPGVLFAALGGGALGVAIGVIWLAGFGYRINQPEEGTADMTGKEGGPPAPPSGPGGFGKGGGGKGGGGPGAFGKGGGGGGKGGFGGGGGVPPTARVQLVVLVNALDTLVDQPVALTLTAEERATLAQQLKGLQTSNNITEEDAKARLDTILKVVEKDRKALEAIGYRWPSPDGKGPAKGGFGGPPKDSPNPFSEGPAGERLKSLQERLDKK